MLAVPDDAAGVDANRTQAVEDPTPLRGDEEDVPVAGDGRSGQVDDREP